MFAGRPFREQLKRRRIGREFEFEPIRQFADPLLSCQQHRSEFVEMSLTLLRIEA